MVDVASAIAARLDSQGAPRVVGPDDRSCASGDIPLPRRQARLSSRRRSPSPSRSAD